MHCIAPDAVGVQQSVQVTTGRAHDHNVHGRKKHCDVGPDMSQALRVELHALVEVPQTRSVDRRRRLRVQWYVLRSSRHGRRHFNRSVGRSVGWSVGRLVCLFVCRSINLLV